MFVGLILYWTSSERNRLLWLAELLEKPEKPLPDWLTRGDIGEVRRVALLPGTV